MIITEKKSHNSTRQIIIITEYFKNKIKYMCYSVLHIGIGDCIVV